MEEKKLTKYGNRTANVTIVKNFGAYAMPCHFPIFSALILFSYLCTIFPMKRFLSFILFLTLCISGYSQKNVEYRLWEDSLIQLRNQVMNEPNETTRLELNEDFMTLLESVLQMDNSFKFQWDSVKNFAIMESPDKLFKLFTWYVLKDDYSAENFGFIQVYNEGRKKYLLFPLYDKRGNIDYPNTYIGNQNRWYGAVYYKIVPLKDNKVTYYTLLGWNGNTLFTNQKVIEVLRFNKDMAPIFGAHIFKGYPEKVSRIIFEYAKDASLHLNYEEQEYQVSSGKHNPHTKELEYKTVSCPMIIFDQLIPLDEDIPNMSANMVPESSINQGFIADNGRWKFMKSVRGANPDKVRPDYQYKPRQIYNPNQH